MTNLSGSFSTHLVSKYWIFFFFFFFLRKKLVHIIEREDKLAKIGPENRSNVWWNIFHSHHKTANMSSMSTKVMSNWIIMSMNMRKTTGKKGSYQKFCLYDKVTIGGERFIVTTKRLNKKTIEINFLHFIIWSNLLINKNPAYCTRVMHIIYM